MGGVVTFSPDHIPPWDIWIAVGRDDAAAVARELAR
jgi:hypothetical protein